MKKRNGCLVKWIPYCKKGAYILLLILLIYNIFTIGTYARDSFKNKETKTKLEQIIAESAVIENSINTEEVEASKADDSASSMLKKFVPLIEINEDIIGWVKIPNTKIDYPVVKTQDNFFYLEHDINKEKSTFGAIFMDYRNSGNSKDKHTILYGHNMRNGSMFRDLINYKNQYFFEENQVIEFSNLREEMLWKIFSVYITNTDFNYIKTDFDNLADYEQFLHEISSKSLYDTNISMSSEDPILTLSTCTYEFNDARLVVHAKKIK